MSALETSTSVPEPIVRGRAGIPYGVIEPLLAVSDAAVIVASAVIGGVAYHLSIHQGAGDPSVCAAVGLIASVTYALAAYRFGIYRVQQLLQRERDYPRVMASWILSVLMLTIVLFLFKVGNDVSRGAVTVFVATAAFGLIGWRRYAKVTIRAALLRRAVLGRRAILIGTQDELAYVGPRELLTRFGMEEVERITLPAESATSRDPEAERRAVDGALQRTHECPVEEILLALPWNSLRIEPLLDQLRLSPLPVRLLPDRTVAGVLRRQIAPVQPCLLVELQRTPLNRYERFVKRGFDIVFGLAAILITMPLMLIAAIVIKIDSSGPVIFRQRRHGFNDREFSIYKFRSMTVLEDGASIVQARKRDPRVTRIGRFLRRTSIDELPQFFNVLKGDMSVVGPRPHALAHDDEYGKVIANYAFRHHVKPGITGWAQVHGYRGETSRISQMQRRIDLDLWYINHWSLWLDLQIMIRTCFEVARSRNAY